MRKRVIWRLTVRAAVSLGKLFIIIRDNVVVQVFKWKWPYVL